MNKIVAFVLIFALFQGEYIALAEPAERDLSRYDSIGPFELNFTDAREQWGEKTAQVRAFLWARWRDKVFARAAINYTSREGIPHPVAYFVERSSSGEWNVVIEAHRHPSGGQVSRRRFVAVVVQRIVARSDGLQPEVAIPEEATVEPERYEVAFKDGEGKIVNIL